MGAGRIVSGLQNRAKWSTWIGACLALFGLYSTAWAQESVGDVSSGRLIVKIRNAVELSEKPTLRRLEKEAETLGDMATRNNLNATWLRPSGAGAHIMKWDSSVRGEDRLAQLRRLRSDPSIEYAIPDRVLRPNAVSNDPSFSSQWYLSDNLNTTATANFSGAWNLFRGSAQVVVAVVDSGVIYNHPEITGRVLNGYDFITSTPVANDGDARDSDASDPGNWISALDKLNSAFSDPSCTISNSSWHGTFISGLIAGNTNNRVGIAGADWNARILPVRVLGKCGAQLSDVVDGIRWAAGLAVPGVPANTTPASVINLSLGGGTSCTSFEQSAINDATAAGALVVASAGNNSGTVEAPARCNNAMAIGALDRDGSRAMYSAWGPEVALMAPGGYYDSLYGISNTGATGPLTNSYTSKVGTSFASPLVAAAAALLKGADPAATPAQLRARLLAGVRPFISVSGYPTCTASNATSNNCNCTTAICGPGMLDVAQALQLARGTQPFAVAAVSQAANGVVTLDAASSSASSGRTVASYQWTQISGPTVLTGASAESVVTIASPPASGDLVFQLMVQDSVGATHYAFASLRLDASSSPASQTSIQQAQASLPGALSGAGAGSGSTPSSSVTVSSGSGGGGGGGGSLSLAVLVLLGFALHGLRRSSALKPLRQQRQRP